MSVSPKSHIFKESDLIGLYLHVPYCRALCHYCDFAKTANWDTTITQAYLLRLQEHGMAWLSALGSDIRFTSLFIGGGTPSLYAEEYADLMQLLGPRLLPDVEVSLEANPDDLTAERLAIWHALGFNRISIGVQTFNDRGLQFMRRSHTGREAAAAVTRARTVFEDINVDLIYGWHGQTSDGLRSDIERVVALGATHISLYALTYEARTPIGRAAARGKLQPASDDTLAGFYDLACKLLADAGFIHEEVSNWALPGYHCRHNALYWRDQQFLGIGVGAHGYLNGLRYHYRSDDRRFLRRQSPLVPSVFTADTLEATLDIVVERDRDEDSWLLEYLGSGIRSIYGISIPYAERRTNRRFVPTELIEQALSKGVAALDESGNLTFHPAEWFLEISWSLEVLKSMKKT